MKELERPYLSGTSSARLLPLGRFLPPVEPGVLSAWLHEQLSDRQWLLDPLGSNPSFALEAARAGFRVIVASNNPVLTFMLEVLAAAPQPSEFQSALAELGSVRRGAERLEVHIQSLYLTICPTCGQSIPAQAFLWRKEEAQPFARLIHCPSCGTEGDFPIGESDIKQLSLIGSDNLHRARALERVVLPQSEERAQVEEALKSYLPRPLYVLFSLINKVEGLPTTPERRRLLIALLLSLCDEANSLWTWPAARSRPRQLSVPPTFRENNLWLALESAVALWSSEAQPVPITHWPELPPETGGICIYPGRVRTLLSLLDPIFPAAVIGVVPRPNQAFWTLSALWAGWLWGRDTVLPLKFAFERQRYDWTWHAGALNSLFAPLNIHLAAGSPFFACLPELAPGFLTAIIVAARAAGLRTAGFALQSDQDSGQIEWRTAVGQTTRPYANLEARLREGIMEHLNNRGEPDSYMALHAAGLLQAASGGALPAFQAQINPETIEQIQAALTRIFSDRRFLIHYSPASTNAESGQYWLTRPTDPAAPLADRLEGAVSAFIQARQQCTLRELEQVMNAAIPGLQTPPPDLLRACLEAVASPDPSVPGLYRLESAPAVDVVPVLQALANRPGIGSERVDLEGPLVWKTGRGKALFAFWILNGAIASPALFAETVLPANQSILVFPASHAALLAKKIDRDPRLSAQAAGWRYITNEKLLQLWQKNQNSRVSLEELEAHLDNQPQGGRDATQMEMF